MSMWARFVPVFIAAALICFPAFAQTSIAVVDVQRLLTASKAARSIETQLQVHNEEILGVLSREEKKLREMEKALNDEKGKIDKDAFAEKLKAYESKFSETRRMAQDRKMAIDSVSANATAALREKLYQVVETIAAEQGFDLVITKQNVVVGAQSIDITDEAMKRLNTALPDVKLDFSASEDQSR